MLADKRAADELSVEELEKLLYRRKREVRRARWARLKAEGRVVDAAGLAPPKLAAPALERPAATPTGALQRYALAPAEKEKPSRWHALVNQVKDWPDLANRLLLAVEVFALVAFVVTIGIFWNAVRELNSDAAAAEAPAPVAVVAALETPTPEINPLIDVVVLPSGHQPPVEGRVPEPGEAGYIPDHLLPIISAYTPPPVPTPGPEQARRLQIPRLEVDKPIVQGDDWESLKKGVGQHIGSVAPGREGNLVLSAHNDIYGEIFRYLDRLEPGDELIIHTERTAYRYIVRELQVVEPTDVWVMAPTEHASATLISCYPYLVNNKRIIVFADLAGEQS